MLDLICRNPLIQNLYNKIRCYDMEKDFFPLYKKCRSYTMTPVTRMYSVYKAVEFIEKNHIPGDFVECGVYKGGSSMMAAYSLIQHKSTSRDLYLYDTFEGMTTPTEKDKNFSDKSAKETFDKLQRNNFNAWCYSGLEEVKSNMSQTGYPQNKIKYIKGKVEETIPTIIPNQIAILRLDTDWYESTYHELKHLYPRLSKNGLIIIDDYGFWKGSREAVDKYFSENRIPIFLNRIDYSGRIGTKP